MPACQLYFLVGVMFFLLGLVGLLLRMGQKAEPIEGKSKVSIIQWILLIIMLGGAGLTANNLNAYVNCKAKAGGCPSSFPAGSTGYTCTNEYEQCAYSKNCLTVKGTWPWESDCECKCVSTN